MTAISPPGYSDDAGDGQSGTAITVAWLNAWAAAINAVVHSSGNPTITPEDIIDEVVTARGSKSSLDGRLDVVLNEDGTLKTQATLVTTAQAQTLLSQRNFIPNSDFLIWSTGDAAAPDLWTLSGAGASIARCGTGLGDTQRAKYGDFAVRLTYGAAPARLTHDVVPTADFSRVDGLKGRKFSVGVWCKTSIPNHASIVVDDGVTQTRGGTLGNGTYHSGSGPLEWLYATHTISSSATKLTVYIETANAGAPYFGDVMGVLSDIAPSDFTPCQMVRDSFNFFIPGAVTTGTGKFLVPVGFSGIVTDCQLFAITAPTGQPLIVDVNTRDSGGAQTTMFTTKPQIAAAANAGDAAPDTTYARRCFRGIWGASLAEGNILSVDVDQVGSGAAGSDLGISIRYRRYLRGFEGFLTYNQ